MTCAYTGNEAAGCTDAVDVKTDAAGVLRYQRTLLQCVVDAFNTVLFHCQQKTATANQPLCIARWTYQGIT